MFSARFRRAALAAVLGLAVWSGLARAADGVILVPGAPVPPYPGVVPGAPGFQDDGVIVLPPPVHLPPAGPSPFAPPEPPLPFRPKPLHDVLHLRHPQCCYANFNDYTCGSLKSECRFIFGSCRTFFGESCLAGRPPLTAMPGFEVPATGNGCGCR
jgi:hypothetical protein